MRISLQVRREPAIDFQNAMENIEVFHFGEKKFLMVAAGGLAQIQGWRK